MRLSISGKARREVQKFFVSFFKKEVLSDFLIVLP